MRFFNNAGPIKPDIHYNIDPIERIDKNEVLSLIDQQKYFVLHAPRQTGKTSGLLALRDYLNAGGNYHCVYANVEDAQAARENVHDGIKTILNCIARDLKINNRNIEDKFPDPVKTIESAGAHGALGNALSDFSSSLDRPLVLLIDEIDSLVGDTLISVLRQLRSGYPNRPRAFPQTVVLCGLREVRDYRIYSDNEKAVITGGSAFNIKSESLRLGDFTYDEVKRLYTQHTEETGQRFENEVWDYVWTLTEGQPWLVNTLAYVACFRLQKDRSKSVTKELIEQAKENIIINRMTHIDILIDKLREDRVRRVIDPIIASNDEFDPSFIKEDDMLYVRDLGLIKKKGNWVISNAIYKEIIPRELVFPTQTMMYQDEAWYISDGRLSMTRLIERFQEFFRENSEMWLERFDYKEAGPHLLLMAFLQRVINGGGRIFREYGLGMKRMDIMVEFGGEKFCLELKIARDSRAKAKGLEQLRDYMDKCRAKEGHLILFNRDGKLTWEEKLYREEASGGITVWGM